MPSRWLGGRIAEGILLAQFVGDAAGRAIEVARIADDFGPAAAVFGDVAQHADVHGSSPRCRRRQAPTEDPPGTVAGARIRDGSSWIGTGGRGVLWDRSQVREDCRAVASGMGKGRGRGPGRRWPDRVVTDEDTDRVPRLPRRLRCPVCGPVDPDRIDQHLGFVDQGFQFTDPRVAARVVAVRNDQQRLLAVPAPSPPSAASPRSHHRGSLRRCG